MIYNEEAETGVLGSAIMDPSRVMEICRRYSLTESCFCSQRNRMVFECIRKMDESGESIDTLTITSKLKEDGKLSTVGGIGYVLGLVDDTPTDLHAEYWVQKLIDCDERRRITNVSNHVAEKASSGADIGEIVAYAESELAEIRSKSRVVGSNVMKFSDYRETIVEYWEDKSKFSGLSTGFSNLDEHFRHKHGNLVIVTGVPSSGKALSIDTKIPTPFGWSTMGEISVGDIVYDENGEECRVIAATCVQNNRPCYKVVFSDGTEIIADEQHEWLTDTWKSRRSASNARKNRRDSRRSLKPRGNDQTAKRTFASVKNTLEIFNTIKHGPESRTNHSIEVCKEISGREVVLEIEPYTLGAWLGDGNRRVAFITSADREIIDEISKHYKTTKHTAPLNYGILGLSRQLRNLGLIDNKNIPPEYMRATAKDRLSLLQGLMDTDGTVSKEGSCEFYTKYKHLACQVRELVSSLGIRCTVRDKITSYNGSPYLSYVVSFTTNKPVFRLKRKLERLPVSIRYTYRSIVDVVKVDSVPVRCIQVSSKSSLYLASESFIPTHNSEIWDQLILNSMGIHGWKWAVFSPENHPPEYHFQKLAEKFVGRPMFKRYGVDGMSKDEVTGAMDFISEHMSVITPSENGMTLEELLNRVKYINAKTGCDGALFDPLNEIEHSIPSGMTETQYISLLLSKMRNFGRLYNIEMVLVAHPTKMFPDPNTGEYRVPSLYDISGSANFYNKADVGMSVWRPFQQQSNITEVHITKVRDRNIGKRGMAELNWDYISGIYTKG